MADEHRVLRCTFSSPTHNAVLLQGLATLRTQGQLLDVVLVVNQERFRVHKAVLASCSDYFRYHVYTMCLCLCVKCINHLGWHVAQVCFSVGFLVIGRLLVRTPAPRV